MNRKLFACAGGLVAGGCLFLAHPVYAQNLVTNGGFEAGTLAGWTTAGDTLFIGVAGDASHSGNWGAYAGPDPAGSLSQTLATVPGTAYAVTFWLQLDDSAQPNSFAWSWNNTAQGLAFTNVGGFEYTRFTATVTAATAASTLRFDFTNPQSFWLIDDISVAAVVPEPRAAALMAGGLLALALMAPGLQRRRELFAAGPAAL